MKKNWVHPFVRIGCNIGFIVLSGVAVHGQTAAPNAPELESVELESVLRPDTTLVDDVHEKTGPPHELWIGTFLGPVDEVLRSQLDLAGNVGIVLKEVVPDGPAGIAGLKKHDILLSVNGEPLTSPDILVNTIRKTESGGELQLEWMRKGERMSGKVVPAERPMTLKWQSREEGENGFRGAEEMQELLKRLGEQGNQNVWQSLPKRFRVFGPGFESKGAKIPENLKIEIRKEGNGPANIVVKRDKDSWTITEKNLNELPDDIRPFVQEMLGGTGMRADAIFMGTEAPDIDDLDLKGLPWPRMQERFDDMDRRMDQMFEQMQKMQQGVAPADEQPAEDEAHYDPDNDVSFVSRPILGSDSLFVP